MSAPAKQIKDMSVAELRNHSSLLIQLSRYNLGSAATIIARCIKKMKKSELAHDMMDGQIAVVKKQQEKLRAAQMFPDMFAAAKKLPETELQMRVLRYKLDEEVKEKERFKAKYQAASVEVNDVKSAKLSEAASKLTESELQLRVLQYKFDEEVKEKERFKTKFQAASLEAMTAKKEKRKLEMHCVEIKLAVEEYQKESEQGYKKREAVNEAYTAELEEALEYFKGLSDKGSDMSDDGISQTSLAKVAMEMK